MSDDTSNETSSETADSREALRRARRAVAKATHPDRGGDAETHRRAMEALEAAGAPPPPTTAIRRRLREVVALPRTVREAYREGRDEDPAP
jgi:hypothetical protein